MLHVPPDKFASKRFGGWDDSMRPALDTELSKSYPPPLHNIVHIFPFMLRGYTHARPLAEPLLENCGPWMTWTPFHNSTVAPHAMRLSYTVTLACWFSLRLVALSDLIHKEGKSERIK